jgi:NitT/TauT family transport system substrate-binding protein
VTRPGATLLAVLLLAGACAAPEPQTVRVGTLDSIDELPLFVMEEKGLARRHGLRLEIVPYPSGAQIIDAVGDGRLDAGWSVGTVPLLGAVERGVVPRRVVAVATNALADPEHPGIGVVVTPGIQGWADLRGKLIGVYAIDSLGGAALRARLLQEGVPGYRLVEIAMPNLGLALTDGAVAAVAMPEPFVTHSIVRGDGTLLDWIIGGEPLPRMVYTVLVARADLGRERPEIVRALVTAHLAAVRWIGEHPDEARALVARRLGITDALGRRIKLLRWPADGRGDDALFVSMQAVLVQSGLLRAPVPPDGVFRLDVLEQVLGGRSR